MTVNSMLPWEAIFGHISGADVLLSLSHASSKSRLPWQRTRAAAVGLARSAAAQFKTSSGHSAKRDAETGRIMAVKTSSKAPFKGIAKESDRRRTKK
jgi:hypothetical protein